MSDHAREREPGSGIDQGGSSAGSIRAWQPIETAPERRPVLVGWRNALGNWRTTKAVYFPAGSLDMDDEVPEDDRDEEGYNAHAGWFEDQEARDPGYWPLNEPLTHWMPLPDPPGLQAEVSAPQLADADMLREMGMDGVKWAAQFMRLHSGKVLIDYIGSKPDNNLVDEDDMRAWFATAIMAGYDEAARRSAPRQALDWLPSEALYAFAGWLTSRDERIESASSDPAGATPLEAGATESAHRFSSGGAVSPPSPHQDEKDKEHL